MPKASATIIPAVVPAQTGMTETEVGGQRHGGKLGLVPHLGDEEGHRHRPEGGEGVFPSSPASSSPGPSTTRTSMNEEARRS